MKGFFNWFVKITAYPIQKSVFRTKIYYEDKKIQSRKIKGAAMVVSNHTSVYDYAVELFVFFSKTVNYQMAEVLFDKKPLGAFLKAFFGKKRARVIIGKPFMASDYYDEEKTEKENLENISALLRRRIIELGRLLDEKRNGKGKEKT